MSGGQERRWLCPLLFVFLWNHVLCYVHHLLKTKKQTRLAHRTYLQTAYCEASSALTFTSSVPSAREPDPQANSVSAARPASPPPPDANLPRPPLPSAEPGGGRLLLLLLSHFSHVRLFATPWTAAPQAPPSMGLSRQEYWSGVPLPSPTASP